MKGALHLLVAIVGMLSALAASAHADECENFALALAAFASIAEQHSHGDELWASAFQKLNEARPAAALQVTDNHSKEAFTALYRLIQMAFDAYAQVAETWADNNADVVRDRVWDGVLGLIGALDAIIIYECATY